MKRIALLALVFLAFCVSASAEPVVLDTAQLHFSLVPETGRYEILDKQSGAVWKSNPEEPRFGVVTLNVDGKSQGVALGRCEAGREGAGVKLTFRPLPQKPNAAITVTIEPKADARTLKFTYAADPALTVENIQLLEKGLWATDSGKGYVVVPTREGLLISADSKLAFTHHFGTYEYEGCHMAMAGVVQNGAAALFSWDDSYVVFELKSVLSDAAWVNGHQALLPSLQLRKSARSFSITFLGKGDYVTVAKAYRQIAAEKGLLVKWDEKVKGHPERAKYFGASNVKLWTTFIRKMSEDSTKMESSSMNWSFDETAQIAEHLKNDLKLDKVLFILGGWIHRGYDSQHPDVLPTAPECGGDQAFSDACRRILAQGYLLGLHDNYQDMYRDAPSWNERYLQKTPDGKPAAGGVWAGGRAYMTCAKMAVELAKRPQNLAAVKKLSNANSYFIDTTYAVGPQECFDKEHPLDRSGDIHWKAVLSDYSRDVFGSFGSECGREWAVPHADFFEGLTGVSGQYYHDVGLPKRLGASVVPLFEMVYRDCIALYGKYGYDASQSAEYVLHHIAIGRPLHYHSIPPHLYWKNATKPLALHPAVDRLEVVGPRRFNISYRWSVEQVPAMNGRVFVHFVDGDNKISFGNDHDPTPALAQWKPGDVRQGPFTVTVPEKLNGTFDIYVGLFDPAKQERFALADAPEGDRRVLVGHLTVDGDTIKFSPPSPSKSAGDPGLFVRADQGWAEGFHTMDRFLKNTHEILSPLNEITSRTTMTKHEFLTTDRKVQHSVFGEGADAVDVVVNMSGAEYRLPSQRGGDVTLPPYGFAVESPTFVAFCALRWDGVQYDRPTLFTLRSLDGKPLSDSKQVRVFHGFGGKDVKACGRVQQVEKEAVIAP